MYGHRSLYGRRGGRLLALAAAGLALGGLIASGLLGGGQAARARAGAATVALQPNQPVALRAGKGGNGGGHGNGHGGGAPAPSCNTGSSALGWASSNWSGYAETCYAPYTSVSGSWTVPTVSSPANSYSAAWVGIDGFNNSDLIQTGTEQDVGASGTSSSYSAWWTTSDYRFAEQPINGDCTPSTTACGQVNPGDSITANISETTAPSVWTITISDASTSGSSWSFTKSLTYSGPGASAEWIVEAPSIGGRGSTLANYGSSIFNPGDTGAISGINGTTAPSLTDGDGGTLVAGHGKAVAIVSYPSFPDAAGNSFAMAYGPDQPGAPTP